MKMWGLRVTNMLDRLDTLASCSIILRQATIFGWESSGTTRLLKAGLVSTRVQLMESSTLNVSFMQTVLFAKKGRVNAAVS